MDLKTIKIVLAALLLALLCMISSCSDEKDEAPVMNLEGTVWVYTFNSDQSTEFAEALCFGKSRVECYELNSNMKVLSLRDSQSYHISGNTLTIGSKNYAYGHKLGFGDNYVTFGGIQYYRTDKSFSDFLMENASAGIIDGKTVSTKRMIVAKQ